MHNIAFLCFAFRFPEQKAVRVAKNEFVQTLQARGFPQGVSAPRNSILTLTLTLTLTLALTLALT